MRNVLLVVGIILLTGCAKVNVNDGWTKKTITISASGLLKSVDMDDWLGAEEITARAVNVVMDDVVVPILSRTERSLTITSEVVVKDYELVGDLLDAMSVHIVDEDGKKLGHISQVTLKDAKKQILQSLDDFDNLEVILDNVFNYLPLGMDLLPPVEYPI